MTTTHLDNLIEAATPILCDSDYTKETDGLLYCGNCHTPKQCRVDLPGKGAIVVGCICQCRKEETVLEEQRREEAHRLAWIDTLRRDGIPDSTYQSYTFDADDGSQPQMEKARHYIEYWETVRQGNCGLLLWGGVGTGKSFFAACIANALIDQCISAKMTNFATILNALSGLYSEERNRYVARLCGYPLLVIDDFGMERDTEYAMEQVYHVIDSRYRSGLPLLVTTNLPLKSLKQPPDIAHARISSRVLEMCAPIFFDGTDRRTANAAEKVSALRSVL